jgi:Domain of unknown function (DUF5916)
MKSLLTLPLLALALLSVSPLCAQNKPGTNIHIKKATSEIKLDGILDEADWASADVGTNFYLNYPVDTAFAPKQTEVRLTFDDHHLYFSFVCYDDSTRDMINSLRRDFDYERNDNVGLNIGPYNDRLNGFFFVLTPAGIQMEGTMSGGGAGEDSWNIFWDNKWYSKVVRHNDRWIAEAAIPFKSFRYKSDIREWNISFDRLDKKRNHKSAWIHTPIQFPTGSMAYSGQLIWDDPIPPAHTNISFIPFVAGRLSQDKEASPQNSSDLQVGFDAKVGVTPSMNLDLTVNPDFSQVEVDQQVINLTRFEFLFPERRTFFLENSDLMSNAGFPDSRTFFSRRIGLVRDNNGLYTRVPIQFGARLSGSINKKWRMSLMNMQTGERQSLGLPAQNYSVATVQHNFWRQSSVSVTYADKESLRVKEGDSLKYFHESIFLKGISETQRTRNNYNRVLTADLDLLSHDNKWGAAGFISRSFHAAAEGVALSAGTYFSYSARTLKLYIGNNSIDKDYNAEMGYVPSYGVYPGQLNYFAGGAYNMYPKNSSIVLMGPKLDIQNSYLPGGTLSDRYYTLGYEFRFLNTALLRIDYNYIYQRMTNTFNPVDSEKYTTFKVGEEYNWQNVMIVAQTNTRRLVNLNMQSSYGGFYNGTNFNVTGQLNYRYQPFGNISMRVDYNDVRFAAGYGKEKLFLVGPRIDLTFTDKLFLTTYVQYNNLLDNVNLNARFQWRYRPASDFFIVYTENYLPSTFGSKNRALVFKFTYWLNL